MRYGHRANVLIEPTMKDGPRDPGSSDDEDD
jgi:hypothetical protein